MAEEEEEVAADRVEEAEEDPCELRPVAEADGVVDEELGCTPNFDPPWSTCCKEEEEEKRGI